MRTCELNYSGNIDPDHDIVMGPDLAGRLYKVVGAQYDSATDRTTVTIEELRDEEVFALLAKAGATS